MNGGVIDNCIATELKRTNLLKVSLLCFVGFDHIKILNFKNTDIDNSHIYCSFLS